MADEQGVLDRADGDVEAPGVLAECPEVLLPLGDGEALAAAVGGNGAQGEEELPGADVEDAVATRVDEREDGRGDRHAHAAQ